MNIQILEDSSTLNLKSTFVGKSVNTTLFDGITVYCISNGDGILYVNQSMDNTNWDMSKKIIITPNKFTINIVGLALRFVQVKFEGDGTNGKILTKLHKGYFILPVDADHTQNTMQVNVKLLPELNIHSLPELNIHSLPELNIHSLPELNIHSLPEVTINERSKINVNSLPEVTINSLPELNIHSLPEVTINERSKINVNSLPEVTINSLPELNINSLPEVTINERSKLNINSLPNVVISTIPNVFIDPLSKLFIDDNCEINVKSYNMLYKLTNQNLAEFTLINTNSLICSANSTIQSKKYTKYDFIGNFSASFENGQNIAGYGNAESGIFFGYNSGKFGLLCRTGGIKCIYSLLVVLKSPTNITIVLNSTTFTLNVASAHDISKFAFSGWTTESRGSTVLFINNAAEAKTGTFSTTLGTITLVRQGLAPVDDWTLINNPDGINNYQIQLNNNVITAKINNLTVVNTRYNMYSSFSFYANSTKSSINIINVAEYYKKLIGSPYNCFNTLTNVNSMQPIFTLKNTIYFNNIFQILSLNASIKHNVPIIIYVYKNAILSSEANYTSLNNDLTAFVDTSSATFTGGVLLYTFPVYMSDLNYKFSDFTIYSGESLTIAAKPVTGAGASFVSASLNFMMI